MKLSTVEIGVRFGSCQIVSVWDVLNNYAYQFVQLQRIFGRFRQDTTKLAQRFKDDPKLFAQTMREYAAELFKNSDPLFAELELKVSRELARDLVERLEKFTEDDDEEESSGVWTAEVNFILKALETELEQKLFLYVREHMASYYGQEKLFGDKVFVNFKSARSDISAAGNCYAVGQDAACAFHLMRVIEHGLRVVAHDMGITWPQGIEYKELGTIVGKLEEEINNRKNAVKPPLDAKTESEIAYYRTILTESAWYKDVKRNPLIHVRDNYNEGEALGLLLRVRDFMQLIAERVKETPALEELYLQELLKHMFSSPPPSVEPKNEHEK